VLSIKTSFPAYSRCSVKLATFLPENLQKNLPDDVDVIKKKIKKNLISAKKCDAEESS
jgi:hypothetical protein